MIQFNWNYIKITLSLLGMMDALIRLYHGLEKWASWTERIPSSCYSIEVVLMPPWIARRKYGINMKHLLNLGPHLPFITELKTMGMVSSVPATGQVHNTLASATGMLWVQFQCPIHMQCHHKCFLHVHWQVWSLPQGAYYTKSILRLLRKEYMLFILI